MKITISDLPADIKQKLNQCKLGIPKACYTNCMHLLIQCMKEHALDYVLVKATYKPEGIEVDHAILGEEGRYYDPTLEVQGKLEEMKYYLVRSFSRDEIYIMMKKKYSEDFIKQMFEGKEPLCILCPDGKGGFKLE